MDGHPNPIEWNERLEELIADEGEKALCYSWLHGKSEAHYSYRNNFIALPVIVLSTLAGTASIGSDSLFQGFEYAPVVIGLVSISVGILNTVGQYFSWAKRSEGHRIAHISYTKLYRFIATEMSLPRKERLKANDLLKIVREQYDRLAETSPMIPHDILTQFHEKFHTDNVSKPEITNGIEKIYVYKEVLDTQGHPTPLLKTSGNATSIENPPVKLSTMQSLLKKLESPVGSPKLSDIFPSTSLSPSSISIENPLRESKQEPTN